jgi:hypothetical protein
VRALALCCSLVAGCGAVAPQAGPAGVHVHLSFAAPDQPPGGMAVSSALLHLNGLHAVSDRSSSDPRAEVLDAQLALGDQLDIPLPAAPPGLYASVAGTLGGDDEGVDLQGVWNGERVHVMLAGLPLAVRCANPAQLDHGHPIALTLATDPAHWLDGVDLSTSVSDSDDNGINISNDDNATLARLISDNVVRWFHLDCGNP